MCAKSLQSCSTLCDPMNWSLPGSSFYAILQARILEWIAMPAPRGPSRPGDQTHVLTTPALAGRLLTRSGTWEAQCGTRRATKPVCHSSRALESPGHSCRMPSALEPCSETRGASAGRGPDTTAGEWPHSPQLEEAHEARRSQHSQN